MFIAERFFYPIFLKKYDKYPISTDGEGTWYPTAGL